MRLTWKRNAEGVYEGNTKTFYDETGKHGPIFRIEKTENGWILFVKGEKHIIGTDTGYKGQPFNITQFARLKDAQAAAQGLEDKKPPYISEADEAERLAWTYGPGEQISSYITAERVSGSLRVSDDGKALISETRYPDGRVVTERREYRRNAQ